MICAHFNDAAWRVRFNAGTQRTIAIEKKLFLRAAAL
jgi:hypothetical protein